MRHRLLCLLTWAFLLAGCGGVNEYLDIGNSYRLRFLPSNGQGAGPLKLGSPA